MVPTVPTAGRAVRPRWPARERGGVQGSPRARGVGLARAVRRDVLCVCVAVGEAGFGLEHEDTPPE